MKNKSFILLFAINSFLLTSCYASTSNLNEKLNYSLLVPNGAPSLPLYYEILKEDNVNTTSNPSGIPSELNKGEIDFIVFDSTKATPLLKKSDNPLYEFSMMLTGGSFHLLGFNKTSDSTPTNNDVVYSFQESGTADLLFKYIYLNDSLSFDITYMNSISDLQYALLNMDENYSIDGNILDWAVVSEPQLTNLMNKWAENGINTSNIIDYNLSTQFKIKNNTWDFNYIPQAALYVKKEFKENNSELYDKIITRIDSSVTTAIENPELIASSMNEFYEEEEQVSIFGYSSTTLLNVQQNKKNGFGIVPTDINKKMNDSVITNFINILNS